MAVEREFVRGALGEEVARGGASAVDSTREDAAEGIVERGGVVLRCVRLSPYTNGKGREEDAAGQSNAQLEPQPGDPPNRWTGATGAPFLHMLFRGLVDKPIRNGLPPKE